MIALERRSRASLQNALLRQHVELAGAYAGRHVCRQLGQHLADQTSCVAHPLELHLRTADDHVAPLYFPAGPLLAASTTLATSAATRSGACAPSTTLKVGRRR